jgi:hypothetical protein
MEPEGSLPQSQEVSATRPNPEPYRSCLGRTTVSVQVRGFLYEYFVTIYVFTVRIC